MATRLSFLFWNVQKKGLSSQIASMVRAYRVHVLILVECADDPQHLLSVLNRSVRRPFVYPDSCGERVRVFARSPVTGMFDAFNSDRMTIRRLRYANYQERATWKLLSVRLEAD